MSEEQFKAVMQEFSVQRAIMADRAVSLAAQIAALTEENAALKKENEDLKAKQKAA